MLFLKITPEGDFSFVPCLSEDLLGFIHEQIDCTTFEIVRPLGLSRGLVMMVDESGLLKDDRKINPLPWHWYSRSDPKAPIVGTVLIGREALVNGEPDIVGLEGYDVCYLKEWENVAKATLYR